MLVKPEAQAIFRADLLNPSSAVFGFFVLSGYSIAASVDRDRVGFYKRRFIRIWPLYIAAVAFGLLVQWLVIHTLPSHAFVWPLGEHVSNASTLSIVASFLMLQSVVSGPIPFNGPLWSLSPEWWHYMVAPQLRKLPTAALLLLILASFYSFMLIHPPNGGIETFGNWRILLVSSWMWVTGFLYFRLRRTPFGFTILAFPATLALALNNNWGLPLFFSIFVLILSTELVVPAKLARFFDFLGDVSYPLYLFHLPALIAMLALGITNSIGLLIGPLALAVLVLYMIDLPLRSRFSSGKEHTKVRAATSASPADLDAIDQFAAQQKRYF